MSFGAQSMNLKFDFGLASRGNNIFVKYYSLADKFELSKRCETDCFFGVFDGYFSPNIANFLAESLPGIIISQIGWDKNLDNITNKIQESLKIADQYAQEFKYECSAALFGVMLDNILYIAHVGDARIIIAADKIWQSREHIFQEPTERERFINVDGHKNIEKELLCCYNSVVSRTIGGYPKRPALISIPQVSKIENLEDIKYILIASEAFWSIISSQQAVKLVESFLYSTLTPDEVANRLINAAVGWGCDRAMGLIIAKPDKRFCTIL